MEDSWLSEEDSDAQQSLSGCIEPFIKALPSQTAELLTAIELNGQSQKSYAEEHGTPTLRSSPGYKKTGSNSAGFLKIAAT